MEFYIARALQVAMMTEDNLKKLHEIEFAKGYCLPNGDIQALFGMEPFKEKYGVTDEPQAMSLWIQKVRREIFNKELMKVEAEGKINAVNAEATASFDWNIYHKREFLDFACQPKGRKGKLSDMAFSVSLLALGMGCAI